MTFIETEKRAVEKVLLLLIREIFVDGLICYCYPFSYSPTVSGEGIALNGKRRGWILDPLATGSWFGFG